MTKINTATPQKLITEQINTPQTGHLLTADELTRVAAFYSLLISIDQKNKAKEKAKGEIVIQRNEGTYEQT